MSETIIRRATDEDMEGIHDAHMRSIREVCVKDHGEEEIRGWGYREFCNKWATSIKHHHVWVVELDNKIYGHAYIRIYEELAEKLAYIYGLYLTPEFIGKGLGKKLLTLMLKVASEEKVITIKLDSTITAHEFYKSFGFKDSRPVEKLKIGGIGVTCYPMSMDL